MTRSLPRFFARLMAGSALIGAAACQTAPAPNAGFLTSYDGLVQRSDTLRASIRERRDGAAATAIDLIYIEPAVLIPGAAPEIGERDVSLVLGEVDRQACYELSERFTIALEPAPGVARIRAAVTRITPTGAAGSGVAAIASVFIPGPLGVRPPGSTGGLAAEAELLAPAGAQVAALAFARDANVVGADAPSLSRVGDALQFAEVFGDLVGDVFAPPDRRVRDIPDPDPCRRFGPRNSPGGFVTRLVTNLYVPETQGVAPQSRLATPNP